MRRLALIAALVTSPISPVHAGLDFGVINPVQGEFVRVVEDVTAAFSYKAVAPAEATGLTGFGLGAFVAYAPTENKSSWFNLTGENVDAVGMAGAVVHKGLPLNIDVGAFYATVPGTSASVYGGELRYALLPGSAVKPALGLRYGVTRTSGIDDFDFQSQSFDVQLSKGFTLLTPYVGAGIVKAEADPRNQPTLQQVKVDEERIFVGLRLSLGLIELTPEYEKLGDNNSFNVRFGLSF